MAATNPAVNPAILAKHARRMVHAPAKASLAQTDAEFDRRFNVPEGTAAKQRAQRAAWGVKNIQDGNKPKV